MCKCAATETWSVDDALHEPTALARPAALPSPALWRALFWERDGEHGCFMFPRRAQRRAGSPRLPAEDRQGRPALLSSTIYL